MKISDNDVAFLKLLQRSKPDEEGWCNVAPMLWKLVEMFTRKELIETRNNNQVRLSARGLIVVEYI